ncbi:MAG: phosphate acyltransferase [Lachnospiraceae bacterium]
MAFNNYDELFMQIKESKKINRVAVVGAEAVHALEAVIEAKDEGFVDPILFGDKDTIRNNLVTLGQEPDKYKVEDCRDIDEAAEKAIVAVKENLVDSMMKGQIETAVLMKHMLNKETGIKQGNVVHSVNVAKIETYHKPLASTDAAILITPTLEQKKKMIENTVSMLIKMGWEKPKVAILSAVEVSNEKIPGNQDAYLLSKMWKEGKIKRCIVEGPMAFDLVISKEAAKLKKIKSEVAGDADIAIFPDLNSGNIATKVITMTGNNRAGSVILGLKCPIVMSSRGVSSGHKYRSLLLATALI